MKQRNPSEPMEPLGALRSYLVQESLGDEWQLGRGRMSNEYHFGVPLF